MWMECKRIYYVSCFFIGLIIILILDVWKIKRVKKFIVYFRFVYKCGNKNFKVRSWK